MYRLIPLLIAAGAPVSPPAATCVVVRPMLLAGQACADAPTGVAIAASADRAAALASLAAQGEARFTLRFARPVPRYAVVEMIGNTRDAALDARLKAAGIGWRLPWLSEQAMADALRASVRRGAEAQADAQHLSPDARDRVIAAAESKAAAMTSPASAHAKDAAGVPHELGHGWFIRAWWPIAAIDGGGHYGGPAPDWMDEVAAVLMEDDTLSGRRRTQFATVFRGQDTVARVKLLDLATFLSGGHPALPALASAPGAGGTGAVRVLAGPEAAALLAAATGFYLQSRLFADYVLARSGDPAAFRTAADAFAGGLTTAQWLASSGPALHLPTTVAAVQADWEKWLSETMPPAAPSRS